MQNTHPKSEKKENISLVPCQITILGNPQKLQSPWNIHGPRHQSAIGQLRVQLAVAALTRCPWKKGWYPQIIYFHRSFHCKFSKHPFWGTPIYENPPYGQMLHQLFRQKTFAWPAGGLFPQITDQQQMISPKNHGQSKKYQQTNVHQFKKKTMKFICSNKTENTYDFKIFDPGLMVLPLGTPSTPAFL